MTLRRQGRPATVQGFPQASERQTAKVRQCQIQSPMIHHPPATHRSLPWRARSLCGRAPNAAWMIHFSVKQRAIQIPCIYLTYYLNRNFVCIELDYRAVVKRSP